MFTDTDQGQTHSIETHGLPRFKCTKNVWASEILSLKEIDEEVMVLVVAGDKEIVVDDDFIENHTPRPGKYLLIHEDGRMSCCPGDTFKEFFDPSV